MSRIGGIIRNATHIPVVNPLAGDNFTVAASLTQSWGRELFLVLTRQFKDSHIGCPQTALRSRPPNSHRRERLHQIDSANCQFRSVARAVFMGGCCFSQCSASTDRYASVAITYLCEDPYSCRVIKAATSGQGIVA
jgi:hypothetical protein